jgi:CPA2 family monovalent cation:H+ antiporter-2
MVREEPLDPFAPVVDRTERRWPSRRLALGLSPMPRPGLVLLLAGTALGPHGLRVLSESALASLDPAVSVALAALGVLVGLGILERRPAGHRAIAAAGFETAATIAVVAMGLMLVGASRFLREPMSWLLAAMAGICAAPSSAAADASDTPADSFVTRIADLDDVVPIVLGVLAIVWSRPGTPIALGWFVVRAGAIAVAIAFAAWLLITQTSSESEQRVFAIGALLLLGGAAAHLSVSALFVGLLAGIFWNTAGGAARDRVGRDMRYLQHPLVVLLLVVAGARLEVPARLVGLVIAYAVVRLAGKRLGGWLAGRGLRSAGSDAAAAPDPGFSLSSPGVVGIAIALNVLQAGDGSAASTTLFAVVVAGSLGAELISLLISRREVQA